MAYGDSDYGDYLIFNPYLGVYVLVYPFVGFPLIKKMVKAVTLAFCSIQKHFIRDALAKFGIPYLGNRKTPTWKNSTREIPTQENFHPDNSHPENSHPGQLPPRKFPSGLLQSIKFSLI